MQKAILPLLGLFLLLPSLAFGLEGDRVRTIVGQASYAALAGERVFVAQGYSGNANIQAIREAVSASRVPIFVALVPFSSVATTSPDSLPLDIAREIPTPMAVAVVTERGIRMNAVYDVMGLSPSRIANLGTIAFNSAKGAGPTGILGKWILEVNAAIEDPVDHGGRCGSGLCGSVPTYHSTTQDVPVSVSNSVLYHDKKKDSGHSVLWVLLAMTVAGGITYFIYFRYREMKAMDSRPPDSGPKKVKVGDKSFKYATRSSPGCGHYYQGGYYNGAHVAPGYYSEPFWQYMILSEVLRDRSTSDAAASAGSAGTSRPDVDDLDLQASSPMPSSGGGDFSPSVPSSSGEDYSSSPTSGGGDFARGDFGSGFSSGGGDWSGSSGGGDFGGGGGDFGGGSSGGGDF